jgi:hypothetical protein
VVEDRPPYDAGFRGGAAGDQRRPRY